MIVAVLCFSVQARPARVLSPFDRANFNTFPFLKLTLQLTKTSPASLPVSDLGMEF